MSSRIESVTKRQPRVQEARDFLRATGELCLYSAATVDEQEVSAMVRILGDMPRLLRGSGLITRAESGQVHI